jgi:hypothetical protein
MLTALIATLAVAPPAAAQSVGSPSQIAWVRRAATNFLTAELHGDGAGACAVLPASQRGTVHRRTCAERWNARLRMLLRDHKAHAALSADRRALPSATIVVHGYEATVELPAPLVPGHSQTRFAWTENCWMLES